MDANKPPTGSTRCEKSEAGITSAEVLIIGFGFSVIPLITELERDGIDYVAVSDGDSSWDKLEKHDRPRRDRARRRQRSNDRDWAQIVGVLDPTLLDRASSYEAKLWRQAAQTIWTLDAIDGRDRLRRGGCLASPWCCPIGTPSARG